MGRKLELLTFCFVFLALLSSIKSQDTKRNLKEEEPTSIKIQKFYYSTYYGLFAQFGDQNPYTPLVLNMRSSLTWLNNIAYNSRNNHYYECSADSKSCHPVKEHTTQEGGVTISGTLFSERMIMGSLGFTNFKFLAAQDVSMVDKNAFPGSLGLGFKSSDPNIPTIHSFFDDSPKSQIFSLYVDNNEGELVFGGYNTSRVANKFQDVPLVDDTDLAVTVKSLSLNGKKEALEENSKAVLDISTPFVMVPPSIVTKVKEDITSNKLETPSKGKPVIGRFGEVSIDCKAISVLKDLQIELEGVTLSLSASSYIRVQYDIQSSGITAGCFLTLVPWDENSKTVILGEPFLKSFYTVFNGKDKKVSFSKINEARAVYNGDTSSPSPIIGIIFLLVIGGALYFFIKKYQKPGTGISSGSTSLFNSGTRIGGGPSSTAGRDRWRHQELSDSLGEHESHP